MLVSNSPNAQLYTLLIHRSICRANFRMAHTPRTNFTGNIALINRYIRHGSWGETPSQQFSVSRPSNIPQYLLIKFAYSLFTSQTDTRFDFDSPERIANPSSEDGEPRPPTNPPFTYFAYSSIYRGNFCMVPLSFKFTQCSLAIHIYITIVLDR